MANKKYKLTDGNYWATDGVYDFDQGKTQREVNGDLIGAINNEATARGNADTALQGDLKAYPVSDYASRACSTTFSYTGASVFIPAHSVYSVYLRGAYNASQPRKVGIGFSDTAVTQIRITGDFYGACAGCTLTGSTANDLYLYAWAEYSSAGNNNILLDGFYFKANV